MEDKKKVKLEFVAKKIKVDLSSGSLSSPSPSSSSASSSSSSSSLSSQPPRRYSRLEEPLQLEFTCKECGSHQMTERTIWPHLAGNCRARRRTREGSGPPNVAVILKPNPRLYFQGTQTLRKKLAHWFCSKCAGVLAENSLWPDEWTGFCRKCRRSFPTFEQYEEHRCRDCSPCRKHFCNIWNRRKHLW